MSGLGPVPGWGPYGPIGPLWPIRALMGPSGPDFGQQIKNFNEK